MPDQSQGKMFVAAERGHTETDRFRSYNTFNFGHYQNEHKTPFGALYLLNDDTLAGDQQIQFLVEEDSTIILLPTVGAIEYTDSIGNKNFIEAGQAQAYETPQNTTITIRNPYENDLINFLQLWIRKPLTTGIEPRIHSFNLEHHKNELINIFPGSSSTCSIGKFAGREEAIYKLQQPTNGLFVFVLEGAFEVRNRLLETRDGLALWNTEQAELEALSDNAIIMLIELAL